MRSFDKYIYAENEPYANMMLEYPDVQEKGI